MARAPSATPRRQAGSATPAPRAAPAGPPELAGDGLRLCPLGADDEALYRQLYTDPQLMAAIGGALSPAAARRSFAIACSSGDAGPGIRRWWSIRDRDDVRLGLAGLRHDGRSGELGVIVGVRHQGAGVARRALGLLTRHALDDLGLARLLIRHGAGNAAVAAIAARLRFTRADTGASDASGRDLLWTRSAPAQASR